MILGAHVSTAGGVSKAPLNAQKLGITAIQIFTKNQNRWVEKPLDPLEIERYRQNCRDCGIVSVTAHNAYLINLCAKDSANLKKSRDAFLDELIRADQLEVSYLVTHPGSHLGAGEEQGMQLITDSINLLFDQQPDGRVRVLLETTAGQGSNLGYRFEQIAWMVSKVENKARIGVCLDTCHIFAAGYDFSTFEKYQAVISDFDRVIGLSSLFAFHFNDSKKEWSSRVDRHDHIGEGKIGITPFGYFLKDQRFERHPALLETPGELDDYARNLTILRQLV
jgi:deoxyribonuclease-4